MEKIYILKKNKLFVGPYTVERLKQKSLKPTDLVWYEGLSDWTAVHEIELLKDVVNDNGRNTARKTVRDKLMSFLFRR